MSRLSFPSLENGHHLCLLTPGAHTLHPNTCFPIFPLIRGLFPLYLVSDRVLYLVYCCGIQMQIHHHHRDGHWRQRALGSVGSPLNR